MVPKLEDSFGFSGLDLNDVQTNDVAVVDALEGSSASDGGRWDTEVARAALVTEEGVGAIGLSSN